MKITRLYILEGKSSIGELLYILVVEVVIQKMNQMYWVVYYLLLWLYMSLPETLFSLFWDQMVVNVNCICLFWIYQ